MKRSAIWVALGMALAVSYPAVERPAGAQSTQPEYRLTQNVRRLAERARVAVSQNNFPAASSFLSQAAGQSTTDGDRYIVATMQLDVGNRTFNAAQQIAAIDALIANRYVGESQRADLYYHRARLAFHSQDANSAHDMLMAAVERGAANPRTFIALASLKTQRGDHIGALTMFDRAVQLQQAAAVAVSEHWYRRAIHIAQRASDSDRVLAYSQGLLSAHPTAANWRDAMAMYRDAASPNETMAIDSWRLQSATGALAGERDYINYARAASSVNALAEIERLVQSGRANSMLDGRSGELAALDRGTTRAAQQLRNAIGGRASSAASASTGVPALAVANDYLTLGEYTAAAPLYRMAIEKGGVDTDLAGLRLGMALALSGDTDGARTAFDAVGGAHAPLARFWRIHVDTRPTPAMVAPAASQTGV